MLPTRSAHIRITLAVVDLEYCTVSVPAVPMKGGEVMSFRRGSGDEVSISVGELKGQCALPLEIADARDQTVLLYCLPKSKRIYSLTLSLSLSPTKTELRITANLHCWRC